MLTAKKKVKEEYDYYITLDELKVVIKCINHPKVRDHYKLLTWFLILTGRRIGEVLAVQVQDFLGWQTFDFSKLNIRLEKTGNVVTVPVVEPLQVMIKEYVVKNHRKLNQGYLFPRKGMNSFDRPFMRSEDYAAFFSKLRARAAGFCDGFKERYPNGMHRIHPHTLRHFFEDYGLEITNSLLFVKELMGYKDIATVLVYANRKRIREDVPKFYDKHVFELSRKLDSLVAGQASLNQYQ